MPTLGTPIPIGVTIDEKAALQGSEGTPDAGNRYLTEDDARANSAPLTAEPTGFPNITDTALSFVSATRTFTITPTGASFDFYSKGTKYTKSSAQSVVIPNTTGLHFVYFDASGTLVSSLVPWSFGAGLAFVATVYWNTAATSEYVLGEERHGLVMDWRTHQYLHETRNTVYVSGFAISGYVLDSDTDADVQFGLTNGQIDDEDLRHLITHAAAPSNPFEQVLTDPCYLPVYYRDGAGGVWRHDSATAFPFKNTAAGRINFNAESGGTWSQQQVANNNYVAYWVFATNDWTAPIVSIQGQREDNTLADARANNGYETLQFGGLPSTEWKLLFRVIYQTGNGFAGTRKAKVEGVDDFRTAQLQPGQAAAATAHSSLTGLAIGDDHPQYQLRAEKSAASGYASLDGTTKVPIAELPTAAPTQGIGAANSEGTATTVPRSDHDHLIRESGGQDLSMGAVADTKFLARNGTAIAGTDPITAKSAGAPVANTPHASINFKDGLSAEDAGGGQVDVVGGLVKTDFAERTTDASYTGTTFTSLLSMTYTKVRADTALIIHVTAVASTANNDRAVRFQLVVDSVARRGFSIVGKDDNGQGERGNTGALVIKLTGLAAGSRSIDLQWRLDAPLSTVYCRPGTQINEHASILVSEVNA
ncbi:MAG: hypothetical protein JSU89_14125 [Myxococcales bacterium]|nr:MAG: hypothetical protein JSU89_14125 [Myxococcales bacterium]